MRSTSPNAKVFNPAWLRAAAPLLALVLSACATPTHRPEAPPAGLQALEQERQQAIALSSQQQALSRLNRVAWPLQRAAAELCPKPAEASLGIRLGNRYFFSEGLRPSALRMLQAGDVLQVLDVVPDSPAQQQGVMRGDHLIRLEGNDLPVAERATTELRPLLDQLQPQQAVKLQLMRDGQSHLVTLTPAALCRYPVVLLHSDSINAYADHRSIQITRGMLGFAGNDWDLAFVIAHELAHNLLSHVPATFRNGAIGGVVDLWLLASGVPSPGLMALAGSRAYSQAFEAEADYVALYLMARAGLPLDQDSNYWRRIAAWRQSGITPDTSATHPDTSRRYLLMQQTLAEIRHKQTNELPLLPGAPGI
ncbi:M48 family metallopeptidase [Motiliproteus sediminis]|uniref:M48 family metallopeptidase n=1 Tax=Motiliproteus sediminis TaxID=1468178 RepID=UPI001AF026A0|nr:M48 family metallopeptidase [Motiliproteus sediminis]